MDISKKALIKMRIYLNRKIREYKKLFKYYRSCKSNNYNEIDATIKFKTGMNNTLKAIKNLEAK